MSTALRQLAAAALVVVTSATGVSALAAQDPDLAGRVDATTLGLVTPVLADAARDSLPVQALRAKVLEGAAKGRPPALIADVVGRLADDLRATRADLRASLPGAVVGDQELVAASLARQQGVPMASVVELWSAKRPGTRLEIPMTVMAELVRRGVPAAGASALMRHVVSTGVPLDRAAQIPGRFDGMARPGNTPPEVLERVLRDLNIPGPPEGVGPPDGAGPPGGRGPGSGGPPGGTPPGGGGPPPGGAGGGGDD